MKLIEKQILDFKMYLDEEETAGINKDLVENGMREKPYVDYLRTILRPDMNVFDLGANIGFFAFIEAGVVNHVYAVEPVRHNFGILEKNIKLNGYKNITAHRLAIGAFNGVSKIYTSKACNCATIIPEHEYISESVRLSRPLRKGIEETPIYTLDGFIEKYAIGKIDLLRMDTEGAEIDIIAGGLKTLKDMPTGSYITMETHGHNLRDKSKMDVMFDQIEERGFTFVRATMHTVETDVADSGRLRKLIKDGLCFQVFFKKA